MKLILRQKLWLAFVVLTNLTLWALPSNVVAQIAHDRHTMLGRYSREHFVCNVTLLGLSLVSLYIDSAVGTAYKRRWFQVIALTLCLVPSLLVVDYLLRSRQRVYYVKETLAYHRVPNERIEDRFVDKPLAARTYPNAPTGYPPIVGTLHTDARGFRNGEALAQADVVVLGDSFAEGSGVSDEHPWPVLLAQQTGLAVYNLGMSGYDPLNYLESLKQFGLALQPRYVLCMLYEGNDFRSAKSDEDRASPDVLTRFKAYWKQSPIISAVDDLLINAFGSIRSRAAVRGIEVLDWMPLTIPDGSNAKHYAFAPKQLADLYRPAAEFSANRKWQNTQRILDEIRTACQKSKCQLVVIYAPTAAHVLLPLAADEGNRGPERGPGARAVSAEKLRAFLALDVDEKDLPEASTLLADLLAHADGREATVADYCRRAGVGFMSMTGPLRRAAADGQQVYFTYDQHWTPLGHQVVSHAASGFISKP